MIIQALNRSIYFPGYILLGLFVFASSCRPETTKQRPKPDIADIIPAPAFTSEQAQDFLLLNATAIYVEKDNKEVYEIARYLSSEVQSLCSITLSIKTAGPSLEKNSIYMILDPQLKNAESYEMASGPDGVTIKAKEPRGLFYGVQTLLQLLYPQTHDQEIRVPGIEIRDEPLFSWRGMHLDVSRHFFSVDVIKKLIDLMAMHKLNTFHWHLTDDQGWRIEIKQYPELTKKGSWRKETVMGHMSEHPYRFDGKRYGGYYTQEQVREVVDYAMSRYVTVVPEIEMPGHAIAALSAYPEYSCTGGPFDVFTLWGVTDDPFCAGKDETFRFLENILAEVSTLFPGTYIHVGGDECPKVRWQTCRDCQKRIKAEGLKNEQELQSYFMKRIGKFLASKNKRLLGWDEIMDGGLPVAAAVMSWRGTAGGTAAAQAGHPVVMTPTTHCYFDHYQGTPETEPIAIAGYTSLEKVYNFNPVPEGLKKEYEKYILGAQANLWTEYIRTGKQLEYMIFPRLCAMSEVLWTPRKKRDYKHFLQRMGKHYSRLDRKGVNYRLSPPNGFKAENKFLDKKIRVMLESPDPTATIRYTIDNSEPGSGSPRFDTAFYLEPDSAVSIKAKAFLPSGKSSATKAGKFEQATWFHANELPGAQPGIVYSFYKKAFEAAQQVKGDPAYTGILSQLTLPDSIRTQEWFGCSYEGYIKIPDDGLYTFYLNSDDGAVLYVHGQLVVNNDGYHYGQEKAGDIALKKGLHPFRLLYFQGKFGTELNLKVESNQIPKKEIPAEMFLH